MPITFYIEFSKNNSAMGLSSVLHNFATLHKLLESFKLTAQHIHSQHAAERMETVEGKSSILEKLASSLNPVSQDKRSPLSYTKFTMPLCHFTGHNLWLLKPTGLNRGRGIHVFQDIESLKELIRKYLPKKKELPHIQTATAKTKKEEKIQLTGETIPTPSSPEPIKTATQQKEISDPTKEENVIHGTTFIIQKYIEMPLLIHKRKFDIRMWVLLSHEMDCYLFKEGYIRTSSSPFVINLEDVDNRFVHLTNNAVQKYDKDYGKFEDGNQMSFPSFQKYIETEYPESKITLSGHILPQIKNLIRKSVFSTRKKLNPENRKFTFELFGYDFIIDSDFNVWLIEVNTNPCLEESSALLKCLLPRMIDDMLKLTVDVVFPPLASYQSGLKKYNPVPGYDDNENMWYFLYDFDIL